MPQVRRRLQKYIKPLIFGVVALLLIWLIFTVNKKISPLISFAQTQKLSSSFFISLLLEKEPRLKQNNGRTNLVILGASGGDHDGADLTDSNIFLSIDFMKADIVMVSVPRDVWLPSLKTKINSVYYYGEKKKKGGGLILAKSSISEILGQPVAYGVKIDFNAFKNVIDAIDGIDINLDKGFEDKLFPIQGRENDFCGGDPEFKCRYETIKFEKGLQRMDGERALKFVRSRNAENGEGNDFSRSYRQQLVITAIFLKVKNMVSINNLPVLKRVFDETYKHIETDMTLSEMASLGKYFLFNQNPKIRQVVLDAGDDVQKRSGLLTNPPVWEYGGQWVLVPRSDDYQEIKEHVVCQLEGRNCSVKNLN